MVDDDIEVSQVALIALTGRSVIGVFHTLSAGNAGQFVPGSVGPATVARGRGVDETGATTPEDTAVARARMTAAREMVLRTTGW